MSNATKNQFYDICASQVANLNDAFIIHICLQFHNLHQLGRQNPLSQPQSTAFHTGGLHPLMSSESSTNIIFNEIEYIRMYHM